MLILVHILFSADDELVHAHFLIVSAASHCCVVVIAVKSFVEFGECLVQLLTAVQCLEHYKFIAADTVDIIGAEQNFKGIRNKTEHLVAGKMSLAVSFFR